MRIVGAFLSILAAAGGALLAWVTWALSELGDPAKAFSVNGLGWSGILFSILVGIFALFAFNNKTKTPGILIVVGALLGIGFCLITIMVLPIAVVGGILVIVGSEKKSTDGTT